VAAPSHAAEEILHGPNCENIRLIDRSGRQPSGPVTGRRRGWSRSSGRAFLRRSNAALQRD